MCSNPNCNDDRREKVALSNTCIKNVKFTIIKTRSGCQLQDTFTPAKT